jgi:hypothetical protein
VVSTTRRSNLSGSNPRGHSSGHNGGAGARRCVRWRAPAYVIACVLVASSLSCGGDANSACTLAGYRSGVEVLFEDPSWSVRELCIDRQCREPNRLVGDLPATYAYAVAYVDGNGVEFRAEGSITTEVYRVNGDRCPPVTANAVIFVDRIGNTTIVSPEAVFAAETGARNP